MKTKTEKLQKSINFPAYLDYQRERLLQAAKILLMVGVAFILGFSVYDYFHYPHQWPYIVTMRSFSIVSLLLILAVLFWQKKEKYFSISIASLTVISFLSLFYMYITVTEKNYALIPIFVYYLLASMALCPLIKIKHFIVSMSVSISAQLFLMLGFMVDKMMVSSVLPHLISLSVFNTIICVKLIHSAKEHYLLAKHSYEIQFIDELTQVYNRKGIFFWIKEMITVKSCEKTFSLIMIDLDYFKKVNDNYGHAMGDQVIFNTADCIKNSLAGNSAVGRLGGEEFLVAVFGESVQQNNQIANEVLADILKMRFKSDEKQNFSVTASIGVAHDEGNQSFSDLLKTADNYMYQAKNNGRNCVVVPAYN